MGYTRPRKHAGPRIDLRKSYPVKLTPGRDDDLIDFLDGIEDGQRQAVIRAALRAFAGDLAAGRVSIDRIGQLLTEMDALKAALYDHLPGLLDEKLAGLSVMGAAAPYAPPDQGAPPPESGPRLSDSDVARREQKMKKAAHW